MNFAVRHGTPSFWNTKFSSGYIFLTLGNNELPRIFWYSWGIKAPSIYVSIVRSGAFLVCMLEKNIAIKKQHGTGVVIWNIVWYSHIFFLFFIWRTIKAGLRLQLYIFRSRRPTFLSTFRWPALRSYFYYFVHLCFFFDGIIGHSFYGFNPHLSFFRVHFVMSYMVLSCRKFPFWLDKITFFYVRFVLLYSLSYL